jgi:hypothetical protein
MKLVTAKGGKMRNITINFKHILKRQYIPTDPSADSSEGRCYTIPADSSYHNATS